MDSFADVDGADGPFAPGGPHPQGFGWPKPSICINCTRSNMEPETVRIDSEIELLHASALASWPSLPRQAGLNFTVTSHAGVATLYALCDQARQLGRTRGSMGLGVKVALPRVPVRKAGADCTWRCAPLPFVVVAVVRSATRVTEAIELCRARGLGGEQGYGALVSSTHVWLIYDKARSPAWYVNQADNTPEGRKTACLKLSTSCHWMPVIEPIAPLPFGAHVLATYGSGSDHHAIIRAEAEQRQKRTPSCGKIKQEKKAQMTRLAKLRHAKFKKGNRIKCKFKEGWYYGTVTHFDGDYYCANFDDQTSYKDLRESELKAA